MVAGPFLVKRCYGKTWYASFMSTMITEVYEAFIDAGATKEKARSAAEAIANHEKVILQVSSELKSLRWMVGYVVLMVTAILVKQFF